VGEWRANEKKIVIASKERILSSCVVLLLLLTAPYGMVWWCGVEETWGSRHFVGLLLALSLRCRSLELGGCPCLYLLYVFLFSTPASRTRSWHHPSSSISKIPLLLSPTLHTGSKTCGGRGPRPPT